MRGYLIVEDNLKEKFFEICFDAYWRDNINLSDDENFKEKLKDLQIDVDNFLNSISKKETKEKLIKLTQDAFDKKIFGAPTFICNDKIFWGQDRLDYAIEEFSS